MVFEFLRHCAYFSWTFVEYWTRVPIWFSSLFDERFLIYSLFVFSRRVRILKVRNSRHFILIQLHFRRYHFIFAHKWARWLNYFSKFSLRSFLVCACHHDVLLALPYTSYTNFVHNIWNEISKTSGVHLSSLVLFLEAWAHIGNLITEFRNILKRFTLSDVSMWILLHFGAEIIRLVKGSPRSSQKCFLLAIRFRKRHNGSETNYFGHCQWARSA